MRIVTAAIAVAIGFVVLLGYFLPIPNLQEWRLVLLDWAIVIGGFSVLIGIFNLAGVHLEKLRLRQKNGFYGLILIAGLFLTAAFGIVFGLDNFVMNLLIDAVIVPAEASLMAILAVTLIYASIRLLRRRVELMSVLFLITAVVFLLAIMPTPAGPLPGSGLILDVAGMLSRGGARGMLIGIALGTLLTGVRVLLGVDRPYGGD